MKKFTLVFLLGLSFLGFSKKPDTRYFELRIYYCHPERLDALITRFADHTTKIFEKHGMTNVGYWVPTKNTENTLYYILSYPSQAARDSSWKQFGRDLEWKEVAKKSEESGKIVAKVTSVFMNATDFSPKIKASNGNEVRTFEMRTYTPATDKLPNVLSRFRDYTLKLFKKHGMTNIAYFSTIEKDPTKQGKLLYILAHSSEDAAKESFDNFRKDPNWIKAKEASEKDGKIVDKVESVFMSPTSFSTIR